MKTTGKQKWIKLTVLVFAFLVVPAILLCLAIYPVGANTPKHYTELKFGSLPEVKIPEYSRFQLQNGIVVYLMEDHELPLVGGTALFRTGDRLEPAEKVGLAGLTGKVMRSGGTQQHPAEQLNQLLEQKAASVETGIGSTTGSASFSALSEDLPTVFELFAEVIQQPAFAAEKLTLAKVQERGQIARRNDDPGAITGREFEKLIYGSTSPYARTVEYATLDQINRADLVNFYQQYFHPRNMILGIVGDFDSKVMRSLIEAKFAKWNPTSVKSRVLAPLPGVTQANQTGIFFVNQPQLTQSYVQLGHLGGQFSSPDYPALSVMNEVLSSFGGRLFNQVRSRQGLAYSVYANWSPQFDYPGVFVAGGQTRSQATVPLIKSVLDEIDKIRTQPISASELKAAKDSVLNSFIFNFQDPSQTLSRLLRYEYFGYPKDFIFQYRQNVEKTSVADVQRVAKTYLKPENLVTLVVGNQQDIQPPLSSLGKAIKAIDISIPAPQTDSRSPKIE